MLYWKISLITQLASQFLLVLPFELAMIAVIFLLFRDLSEAITRQMKTCITRITIKDLIGVIIKATKAYFAVGFEQLFNSMFLAF